MTRSRSSPVESFGPELLATLIKGAIETVEVPLPYRKAVRLRQRLYQLRSAMVAEKHPKADDVKRVHIKIAWGPEVLLVENARRVQRPKDNNSPCVVIVAPKDSEFFEALSRAGVVIEDNSDSLLDGIGETK